MRKIILFGFACFGMMSILFTSCKKSNPAIANANNAIAYIYKTNNEDGLAFKGLMEKNNCTVQLIEMADVPLHGYAKYKLIVADDNTSEVGQGNWTDAHVNTLKSSGKPMLLLGMGGLLYAKKIGNAAHWDNCGQFEEAALLVMDKQSNLFKKPKLLIVPPDQKISLFTAPSLGAGQQLPGGTLPGVTLIGAFPGHPTYYPLSNEKNRYTVFGFYKGVSGMTAAGKDFMVNLVYASGNLSL